MASGFAKRNVTEGCVNIGMQHIKYILGIMHWSQEESNCSCTSYLTVIADTDKYKDLLDIALDHATLRKFESNQADTLSKSSDSGKFKDERAWTDRGVNF